jgi:RimJ/RimL family protein N-acetyltransferase
VTAATRPRLGGPPPPETPRLAFRELEDADLDFVATMLADPEVMRYYPAPYTRDEAAGWLAREPLGQVGLVMQQVDGRSEPEIGYLIHRPFWRRGFATEAARATRDHAFGALGKPHMISLIRAENLPSQGVAAKLGMSVEKRTLHAGIEHLVFGLARPA